MNIFLSIVLDAYAHIKEFEIDMEDGQSRAGRTLVIFSLQPLSRRRQRHIQSSCYGPFMVIT